MYLEQRDLLGSAFVGVFAATNDKVTLLPHNADGEFQALAAQVLGTEVLTVSIAGSPLIGIMAALNNRCIALPRTADKREHDALSSYFDEVIVFNPFTAVGNMMSANDHGLAVSPLVSKAEVAKLAKAFGVRASATLVAGMENTGSCIVATNKGFLASPRATTTEIRKLKTLFKADGTIGSLNYGNPFVKGCILANSKGGIVGTSSTPFELGRVDDALFFKK